MMLRRILNIEDLRRRARRRLPRILFDWVEGGVEDETGLDYAQARLAAYRLVPRYLRDITHRSLRATLFDREYGRPFGIAPTGYTGLLRPGGERMLATVAQTVNVPYVLSGVSVASIEEASGCAPEHVWFQLYPGKQLSLSLDLIRRARDAGVPVLVITADLPIAAKRERDIRHGFKLPLRYTPRLVLDGILHPAWTASYFLSGGLPPLGSWAAYVRTGASATEVAMFQFEQKYPTQTWADVEQYRRAWPGKLVIKGLLHPADALRAQELGADGIIVSNHGGRQLDRAVAPIDALPAIKAVVGSRLSVMLDGGVRRGADIAVALALGADFVFLGRAVLYGLVARGLDGANLAIEILTDELTRTMAQVGATDIRQLNREVVAGGD
jgi:L-lactate dehydrogenase (cytochrome)/(S)-mandelate dehydrogenase